MATKLLVCRSNHHRLWEYTQLPNNEIYEVMPKENIFEIHFTHVDGLLLLLTYVARKAGWTLLLGTCFNKKILGKCTIYLPYLCQKDDTNKEIVLFVILSFAYNVQGVRSIYSDKLQLRQLLYELYQCILFFYNGHAIKSSTLYTTQNSYNLLPEKCFLCAYSWQRINIRLFDFAIKH